MCCITAYVLQTKVDAQYDKLATELAAVDVFELFVESPQFQHTPSVFGVSAGSDPIAVLPRSLAPEN